MNTLCPLKQLTDLSIGSNQLDPEKLPDLSCLPKLERLNIGRCHLRNPHLAFLVKMPWIKQLEIYDNFLLSDKCMPYCAKLHQLEDMKLEGTQITLQGLTYLKGIHMQYIKLGPKMLNKEQLVALGKMFPEANIRVDSHSDRAYSIYKDLFEK